MTAALGPVNDSGGGTEPLTESQHESRGLAGATRWRPASISREGTGMLEPPGAPRQDDGPAQRVPGLRDVVALHASPTLEWATRLLTRGVNVIPLDGKRPLVPWRRWQTERQLDLPFEDACAYLLEHFSGGPNVGAITGAVSGTAVFDVDSVSAREVLTQACGGSLPTTVTTQTKRGPHVWFAHPGGEVSNRVRVGGAALDLRGDGGYVVVPPSVHPVDGSPYTWQVSPDEVWPPAKIPQSLLLLLRPSRLVTTTSRPQLPGGRYAKVVLERETAIVRAAPEGERNHTLNRAAFSIARLVACGEMPAREAAHFLAAAGVTAGLPLLEARRTVTSAFHARGAPCPW